MTITKKNLVFVFALLIVGLMVLASAQEDQAQKMAFDITGSFEGGKPNSLQTYDAGIISYGMHQATLASGSLYNVLERYTELSKTSNSEGITKYLLRVQSRDITLRNDVEFLNLLRDAASESAMVQAQNEIFSKDYYEPAKNKAATDGVTSPLGIAIYYDTNIQGGLEYIRRATNENFIQSTPTEQEWLSTFLDERRNYLLAVADNKRKKGLETDAKYLENSASSKGRLGVLENLVDAGNLNLDKGDSNQQISLGIFGKIYTIDSEFRANNYGREQYKEEDTKIEEPPQSTKESVAKSPTSYKSTIPIPSGPAADALKAQGKYEEYLQNALQEAEERIAKDPHDEDAWRAKSLALYYLNRGAESETALAKANELSHGYVSEDNRITPDPKAAMIDVTDISQDMQQVKFPLAISEGLKPITQAIQPTNYIEESNIRESSSVPTLYPTTSPPPDESIIGESSSIPTLYPTTSPPPYESETWEGSGIPTLYPTTSPPPDESNRKDGKPFGAGDTSFGATSSSSDVESSGFGTSSDESDLGGINFTSIRLNYVSVSPDDSGGVNFDLGLKAKKAEGTSPGIDVINSTLIGATAFMTGLAVPSDKFWVNLNPWEPDRIIDEQLSRSDVGRIMLEADLQMKKDTCNYENPCTNEAGMTLSNLLDEKRNILVRQCMNKFPGEIDDVNNVVFRAGTRYWIVPDSVYAYSNGTQIYIINATLAIQSEPVPDRTSFRVDNQDVKKLSKGCLEELNKSSKEYGEYYEEMSEQIILPFVVADVNHGEKYEDLREVFVALALAQWYKSNINSHKDIFRDSLDSSDSPLNAIRPWNPNEIWENYVYSYENGEYECYMNTTTKTAEGAEAVNIFIKSSGGVAFHNINDKLVVLESTPPEIQETISQAITDGFIDKGTDVFFGIRMHGEMGREKATPGSDSLKNVDRRDPSLAITWINKGNKLNDQGKYDDAIEAYEEAIRLDPSSSVARSNLAITWNNKGNKLNDQGKYDDAIEAYEEAIRLDPENRVAWHNKGNALSSQGKYSEAIQAYDEAIRLDPENPWAWYAKGVTLGEQGIHNEALLCFEEAIRLDADFASAWNNKGVALESLGRSLEADAAYFRARELS
ncbi:MAG: putative Chitosanase [Methanothrix sp.]|jgi:tetratricopeptide (TPR) repeat protein|nr:MAG: putative Chitosanase [Methanothrix sp.]